MYLLDVDTSSYIMTRTDPCSRGTRKRFRSAKARSFSHYRLRARVRCKDAAREAGQIRADLAAIGKRIGAYDLLIAGHARALEAILVTNNVQEFSRVERLSIENWTTKS